MNIEPMNIKIKKLSELHHPNINARMHPQNQIKELKRSIQKDGQTRLIVVDEYGSIWIGNGLYIALKELGYEEAYCLVKEGMTEKEKKKMMLADNRIFDLGVDDMAAFDTIIAELGDDLDVPGFDEELLRTLTADAEDIDNIISEYGIIDESKKSEMTAAKESYDRQRERQPESAQTEPAVYSNLPDESHATVFSENKSHADQEERKFVICPKCGEKIWL